MKHLILLADSQGGKQFWLQRILSGLAKQDYGFYYWGKNRGWLNNFADNHWPASKFNFNPSWYKVLIYVYSFFNLWRLTKTPSVKTVVCLGQAAKILITPLAQRLGLAVVWLELPESPAVLNVAYLVKAATVRVIVFSSSDKTRLLSAGLKEKNLRLIFPGIVPE